MCYVCNDCYFFDQCFSEGTEQVYKACDGYTPLINDIDDPVLEEKIINERRDEFNEFWNKYIDEYNS